MVHFISKILVHIRHAVTSSLQTQKLHFIEDPFFKSISTCSIDTNQHSFTVSYLTNSRGLSPESALKISKHVKFETPEKPDSVLAFFKNYGFSDTQVSKIITSLPRLMLYKPEKTLLPKLQFFYSKGFSVPELSKILASNPSILQGNLEKQLIPTFEFFRNLLHSEEKTLIAIKRYSGILLYGVHRYVAANINILRENGVPESNIMVMLFYSPRTLVISCDKFSETVEEVKKMGIDPSKCSFVIAIQALRGMSKSTWERKLEIYKRWGWSQEVILQAFTKHPWCMKLSEEKIMETMDFLVNKMGWDSSVIARRPQYISLSLDKRIIPRFSVVQDLLSKGLIKKDYSLRTLLESTEKVFLHKFLSCYEAEAPHLLKLYREKLGGAN